MSHEPTPAPLLAQSKTVALTDQAIAKIEDLIATGEFAPGRELPAREGASTSSSDLSRNSLREAVRALTLIGVLEPRQGDIGAYVTSLEPELLLAGTTFFWPTSLTGPTVLELYQVTPHPRARCHGALVNARLTEEELDELERVPRAPWTRPRRRRLSSTSTSSSTASWSAACGNRHPRLADPEPLGRDAARACLARHQRARRRREHASVATGTSSTPLRDRRRRAGERCRPHPSLRGRALAGAVDRRRGRPRRRPWRRRVRRPGAAPRTPPAAEKSWRGP